MYYKQIENGYLLAVGHTEATAAPVTAITEEAYNAINAFLATRPPAPDGYAYRPTADLQWELYALPPAPQTYTADELAAMTNAELEQILYDYGISASLNKANLVRLILAAQSEEAVA